MTNKEFIRKYGVKEMRDLLDNIDMRLSILRLKRKINKFKISKRKQQIYVYNNNQRKQYEVANLYSLSDNELVSLLHN